MTERDRIRRPVAARTTPIRKWDGLLGEAGASSSARGGAPACPASADDLLARSVELGYRVVDEYLKRGQEAAQRVRRGVYGAEAMAQDAQSVASQLVRTASDFAGAWVEFFALAGLDAAETPPPGRSTVPAASQAPPPPAARAGEDAAPAPSAVRADAAEAPPLRVRLVVDSPRPVETALDVEPIPAGHALTIGRLGLASDAATRLTDVRVAPGDDGVVRIHVTVPVDQAPGRYTGMVVDDRANVPVGELTIVVPAAG
ncbi:MAG: hypothetical protein IT294_17210 [Deltaproteobacteria bacterium]|nr:hypothetical protein [Deltaproteobacteria bacterium]